MTRRVFCSAIVIVSVFCSLCLFSAERLNAQSLDRGNLNLNPGNLRAHPVNFNSIAILRWYAANLTANFTVTGNTPVGVAFDGNNLWVVNQFTNNVTKLRANDGAVLGTFKVGSQRIAIAFDGAHMWVANGGSNNVTELRASDGAVLFTFPVGQPQKESRLTELTSGYRILAATT